MDPDRVPVQDPDQTPDPIPFFVDFMDANKIIMRILRIRSRDIIRCSVQYREPNDPGYPDS